jgi:hypothetical protein
VLPLATERACQMFTAEQYRAKAAEFRALLTNTSRSPNETREFRNLEKTYTTLAENEEWMAVHIDKTIQRRKNYDNHAALAEEDRANFEVPGRGRAYALNGSSSTAPAASVICSKQRHSRDG